jgi:chitin disaccharide deacetylase
MLFVNADDFGLDREATDRILCCYHRGAISRASAMTFMRDSERAAEAAKQSSFPMGLHLNLTRQFSGSTVNQNLRRHHLAVASYLNRRKINQFIFNPLLGRSLEYVCRAQWDEFVRLYGQGPKHLDGHHHMHLCMNMLLCSPLPSGLKLRRNFTFLPGERNPVNRLYRRLVDRYLACRYPVTDHFFSLIPIEGKRLTRILELAASSDVELMVHPGRDGEYAFLMSEGWAALISGATCTMHDLKVADFSRVAHTNLVE